MMQKGKDNSIKYVLKKLDSTYATWFQNSKSFLLLEEPAFEVLKHFSDGIDKKKITTICQEKFGHLEENIPQFVAEIIQHIEYFNDTNNTPAISKKHKVANQNHSESFYSRCVYNLGDEIIEVKYGNEDLEFAVHPLIAHLEISNNTKANHTIDCFIQDNLVISEYNGQLLDAYHKDDFEYFTGGLRQLMYSILYKIDYYDWMAMFHASGIKQKNESILFSAAAGSGKTTISALLKAHGFGYLSDDFIAGDAAGKAYPFPAAISVKEGSVKTLSEFYPELLKTATKKTFIGKEVKYIPINNIDAPNKNGVPVKAFVFVQFVKNGDFVFEKVGKREALQLLLRETWVNPKPEFVSRFFDWIDKLPFYRLLYSETEQALETVQKIFAENEN